MKYSVFPCICFVLLAVFCFLVFEPVYNGVDDRLYIDYTRSIVEDGDFNVANQMYAPGAACELSPTFNVPDFHNHGGIVIWTPFYLYGKLVFRMLRVMGVPAAIRVDEAYVTGLSWVFSTVVFALGVLLISFLVLRRFFNTGISCISLGALFFGTPFFYYVLYQNGNANIAAAFFCAVMVWFAVSIMEFKRSHLALLGLFFSVCICVKVDLWFTIFFIVPYLVFKALEEKGRPADLYIFFVCLIPAVLLKGMNDYLKYGMLFSGEFSMFNPHRFFFWEQVISPYHGFVYTSPILAVPVLGLFFSAWGVAQRRTSAAAPFSRDAVLVFLSLYLIAKVYLISFRFAWGGGTVGARILLSEFIVLSLLCARAFTLRSRVARIVLYASFVSIVWNMIVVGEFITGADMSLLTAPVPLSSRFKSLAIVARYVLSVKEPVDKLIFLSPLILIAVLTFAFERKLICGLRRRWKGDPESFIRTVGFRYFRAFTLYSFLLYVSFSGLNLAFNRSNVERMHRTGFFENCTVVGKKGFTFRENDLSLDEMIYYYGIRNIPDVIERLIKIKESLR